VIVDATVSILTLLRDLVAVPSRGGADDYGPVTDVVVRWLGAAGIAAQRLQSVAGTPTGIVVDIGRPPGDGPRYVLNATLDTAGFGDLSNWGSDPVTAELRDGWLYGRGSADSKAGAAVFCHVARDLFVERARLAGTLTLLFDLEEHTGAFAGVQRFTSTLDPGAMPRAVYIGYPGNDRIVVGGRGFERAIVTVHGRAAHSGSSQRHGSNAVLRAARLAADLAAYPLPVTTTPDFPLPPQLTITAIAGGEGFSMVPDACSLNVDIRLTTTFTAALARRTLAQAVEVFDAAAPDERKTRIEWIPGWPAYRLDDNEPAVRALQVAACVAFGRDVPTGTAGPSNVGNYLATLGVPATSGFGVTYRNLHAPDECIEVASIEPVYGAYRSAVRSLLGIA
jgi:succinyl-diaminopimelate desuccinylase